MKKKNEINLEEIISRGESETLELKRSSGEMREAMQTLCAFANGKGGTVIIGVTPNSRVIGQQVGQQTLHEISAAREKFEPPVDMSLEQCPVGKNLSVILLSVKGFGEGIPVTFDGRPFERISNTTRRMPQRKYESLLLERSHSQRRWENQVATEFSLNGLNSEEVKQVISAAQEAGRWWAEAEELSPRFYSGSGSVKAKSPFGHPLFSSGRNSCQITHNVNCAWPDFGGSRNRSSSIRSRFAVPRFNCSRRPKSSVSVIFLFQGELSPTNFSALTAP